jgi:nitroreductase
MDVSQAMAARMSVRAFLDTPVGTPTLLGLLEKAARAPSGGNLQPWQVAILNGERMAQFRAIMERRIAGETRPGGEPPQYRVYPENLGEPWRTRRFEIGERMYALLGIAREDRESRRRWFANNFRFFGAPAAIFCFVDRAMGAPQWSDLGMFLQSFMLLAAEAGLDTCPQECWSMYPATVGEFCKMPDGLMLFCGVAVGHRDPAAAVNALQSPRAPLAEWVSVI